MWKCTVLLLLALAPSVNSTGTPKPRQCAVCLEKDCADVTNRIYLVNSNSTTPVWHKKTQTQEEIPNCSMDNIKPNAPCQNNGSLILQTNERLHFEGKDSSGELRSFTSENMPCANLGLPSSSKPPDGEIWDQTAPRQDYDMRHHYWLLMVPLVLAVVLAVVILTRRFCRCSHQRTAVPQQENYSSNRV